MPTKYYCCLQSLDTIKEHPTFFWNPLGEHQVAVEHTSQNLSPLHSGWMGWISTARKIPQRIMGYRQELGVMPNDRVSQNFSRILTESILGCGRRAMDSTSPQMNPTSKKKGVARGAVPKSLLAQTEKATPGFRSVSKQKMTQLRPASDLCNQRWWGREGWAVHCYANEMQKNSRTPGAPSNSGLRESPKMLLPHVQDIKISLNSSEESF